MTTPGGRGFQLRYYIALAAPPIRAPAEGNEAYLRPEVGFNPNWFHRRCGIDFSERWHTDPVYRRETIRIMAEEIRRSFPGRAIGGVSAAEDPSDLITGIHGAAVVGGMFGMPVRYFANNWPSAHGPVLGDEEAGRLEPPDLSRSAFFQSILAQVDEAARITGSAKGYLNWQGVLNSAFRLRGEAIFTDMLEAPARAHRVFDAVAAAMIEGARLLYECQSRHGFEVLWISTANCMLNMISARHYREILLPYDLRLRRAFEGFGVHNCAWSVDPHMEAYASIPDLGYIDMGLASDLGRARQLFPRARRNLLYTPMDLRNKTWGAIRTDLDRIAAELGPCDLGLPDIEADVPDARVLAVLDYCAELSEKYGGRPPALPGARD